MKTCKLLRGQKYARGNCQAQMTPQYCEELQRNPQFLRQPFGGIYNITWYHLSMSKTSLFSTDAQKDRYCKFAVVAVSEWVHIRIDTKIS